ncbi:hypothetical protein KC19_2G171800 [Ceratodon purpureus]|uniref:Uncharacterized protein n=1 Tax=Ceratodon purpureus TaxID=3225 RepID=A0A8T0IYR5_CERPU|nr:hypothetical protein KC19_2G171800 [Ceratodon purpureus]
MTSNLLLTTLLIPLVSTQDSVVNLLAGENGLQPAVTTITKVHDNPSQVQQDLESNDFMNYFLMNWLCF